MGLAEIIIAVLIVILIYKLSVWGLAKVKVVIDNDILMIAAILLLIAILVGRVRIGF